MVRRGGAEVRGRGQHEVVAAKVGGDVGVVGGC